MTARPVFDCEALFDALDVRRQQGAIGWYELAAELWEQSSELNAQRSDHPICGGALQRLPTRGATSCQYALFMLRWLGRAPEDFLTGAVVDVGPVALPEAGPDNRLRWDLSELHGALNEERVERGLTWAELGRELDCTPSRLTNLRTARLADMDLAMRITPVAGTPGSLLHPSRRVVIGADWPIETGVLELGDLAVEGGGTIHDARLGWQAHGRLDAAGDNAIVVPTSYTATHDDEAWLVGPDGLLDPTRWYVVIVDQFSNGVSSSAADTEGWPAVVTAGDNVRAQHRLLQTLGVQRVAAAYGFSMGAIMSYHWAALFPDMVERAIVVCGSARTAEHNQVFLSGLLRILEAAPEHLGGGRFEAEPALALTAFGHVYAGWGLSQEVYREQLYRTVLGAPDLETYLRTDWAEGFGSCHAANLYAQATTWLHADIALGGDLPAALAAIRAQVLLVPCETDLYFRVADNAAELPHLRAGDLRPIPSVWGHRAGSPAGLPDETAFLRAAVTEWLDGPAR